MEFLDVFDENYFAKVNYKIEDYVLQKEEVEAVKYFSIEELEKIKKENNKDFTIIKWANFDKIINFLKIKRKEII